MASDSLRAATSEAETLARLRLAAHEHSMTLWRNNVAMAWVGTLLQRPTATRRIVVLQDPRPLHAGLCSGSSDLIGWTRVTVTPDMVGRTIAVFTAIEAKALRGRATSEQTRFLAAVRAAGGVSGIAHSPHDLCAITQSCIHSITTS